jgi:hypothetical protein
MKKKIFSLSSVLCLISSLSFAQTTYYVKQSFDGGSDNNDGLTIGNAFATIQKAHTGAVYNETTEISDGTYTEASMETTKLLTIKGESTKSTIIQAFVNQLTVDVSDATENMNIFKVTNGIFSLAISDTSIAKDAGDCSCAPSTETGGYDQDSNPNIGAYEFDANSSLPINNNLLASTHIQKSGKIPRQ